MTRPSMAVELLDLVDADNVVVARIDRALVHGRPELQHRAVHILVRNRAGAVYLQQRALDKDVQPGKWDMSVGGHLAAGEGYLEAALREAHEELGVHLAAADLRLLHAYVWRSPIETEHVRTFALSHDGPFRLDRSEIQRGRFWTQAELQRALGSGTLTPNLEHELQLLGLLAAGDPDPPRR